MATRASTRAAAAKAASAIKATSKSAPKPPKAAPPSKPAPRSKPTKKAKQPTTGIRKQAKPKPKPTSSTRKPKSGNSRRSPILVTDLDLDLELNPSTSPSPSPSPSPDPVPSQAPAPSQAPDPGQAPDTSEHDIRERLFVRDGDIWVRGDAEMPWDYEAEAWRKHCTETITYCTGRYRFAPRPSEGLAGESGDNLFRALAILLTGDPVNAPLIRNEHYRFWKAFNIANSVAHDKNVRLPINNDALYELNHEDTINASGNSNVLLMPRIVEPQDWLGPYILEITALLYRVMVIVFDDSAGPNDKVHYEFGGKHPDEVDIFSFGSKNREQILLRFTGYDGDERYLPMFYDSKRPDEHRIDVIKTRWDRKRHYNHMDLSEVPLPFLARLPPMVVGMTNPHIENGDHDWGDERFLDSGSVSRHEGLSGPPQTRESFTESFTTSATGDWFKERSPPPHSDIPPALAREPGYRPWVDRTRSESDLERNPSPTNSDASSTTKSSDISSSTDPDESE